MERRGSSLFFKIILCIIILQMKPNYNDLPSEFFGSGKGRLCEFRGARRDVELPHPEPPLVSRPFRVENLRS